MEIPLKNGGVALIDDADYPIVANIEWRREASKHGRTAYATYAYRIGNKSRCLLMHRLILGLTDPLIWTDHINHNGLDNRRANLRPATPTQSNCNVPLSRANKSGFKGVYFCTRTRRWVATIKSNRRTHRLGYFRSPLEAAYAYDCVARLAFRQFAYLNFPHLPSPY